MIFRALKPRLLFAAALGILAPGAGAAAAGQTVAQRAGAPAPLQALRARTPEREVIYFVLPDRFENGDPDNDRGHLAGDRLKTGFDPADKAFYHGGDLKGLIARLGYIQDLGASAIWVGPVFKNKPVQGPRGQESAGYHGYWITDFTHVDPHFGTDADFRALVDAAHARGMKVYMDIIVNHTADVIRYAQGGDEGYPYRDKAHYPFSRRGGVDGRAINEGFAGDADPAPSNWAKLTDPSFAYTPVVPPDEAHVKVPGWLNDPIYYHNRGNTDWEGESAQYGDFVGLDDLATENPRVVAGMIDIYGSWIDRFGIDGFRIDTAKHVNPAFWRAFVPAILARAKARGIPNFHIFGEVTTESYDPATLADWTRNAGLPAVLDFGFMHAVLTAVGGAQSHAGSTRDLARMVEDDALYAGGKAGAMRLPTFLGNHDAGRIAMFLQNANPKASRAEILARDRLAHAMLLTLRGVPTIYYGDEQGFAGSEGDQGARQDMFPSKTALYNTQALVGSGSSTAISNFDERTPLFTLIAKAARLRRATPALTDGRTVLRTASDGPGLFAVSRFDPATGGEVLLAFNTADRPVSGPVEVDPASRKFAVLLGQGCAGQASAPGSLALDLPPFGFAVCAAKP